MFHSRTLQEVNRSNPFIVRSEKMIHKLCLNGHGLIPDPSTGHPACLCYFETHPVHSFQGHPAFRGIQALASPRPTADDGRVYLKQLSAVKSLAEQTNGFLPSHLSHPYGAMIARVEVSGGPMKKIATRETTGPLKVWLSDHTKNPYPTRTEKMMLAIITRMTLTQVSTWFANARRRLKKDKRQNRVAGEEINLAIDSDMEGDVDSVSVNVSVSENRVTRTMCKTNGQLSSEGEDEPFSDVSNEENDFFRLEPRDQLQVSSNDSVSVTSSPLCISQSETFLSTAQKYTSELSQILPECNSPVKSKPKIWSIANILEY